MHELGDPYIKKPIPVRAKQWFKPGDHPAVTNYRVINGDAMTHSLCGALTIGHGSLDTLEGRMRVCPGSWIVTGAFGEHWAVRDSIFRETYLHEDGRKL